VPSNLLNPRNTWKDKDAYDNKAHELALAFIKNFEQYASRVSADVMESAPKAGATVNA
jgi:phosphoenolpyruvate carboxykinase (ATP)